MVKVIPKKLWIRQLIHALTVAGTRIKGCDPINSLYHPLVNTPLVGASLFGDNLAGCHPSRLHLPPTTIWKT